MDDELRQYANRRYGEVTYTCTPPGSGIRIALDRDQDGFYNGDEWYANSDPADASSVPSDNVREDSASSKVSFKLNRKRQFKWRLRFCKKMQPQLPFYCGLTTLLDFKAAINST